MAKRRPLTGAAFALPFLVELIRFSLRFTFLSGEGCSHMVSTMFEKIWDSHIVAEPEDQPALIYIDLHLVHEVTSPQSGSPTGKYAGPISQSPRSTTTFRPTKRGRRPSRTRSHASRSILSGKTAKRPAWSCTTSIRPHRA